MHEWATAISHSALSGQLQEHVWIVPAFQSLHIVALAILFFSAVSVGTAAVRGQTASGSAPWVSGTFGWTWVALIVLLLSGSILIGAEPVRSLMNLFFRVKLVLVIAAAAVTLLLQRRLAAGHLAAGIGGKALALVPVLLWVATIFCGRLIAYFGDLTA
jgi:hypothetical protein